MNRFALPRGRRPGLLVLLLSLVSLLVFGCSNDPDDSSGQGRFISDNPNLFDAPSGEGGAGGTNEYPGAGGGDGTPPPEPAEVALEEEALAETAGDRLYALSTFGGLSVIDIATPGQPKQLGQFTIDARPLSLHLHGNVALVVYDRTESPDSYYTGRVVALDVTDPASMRVLGDAELHGNFVRWRVVGDLLFVVSSDADCTSCQETRGVTVTSFKISNTTGLEQVASLFFELESLVPVCVTLTDKRAYLGLDAIDAQGKPSGKIQAVELSDLSGALTLGPSVLTKGVIGGPSSMDERAGVLRVVSWGGVSTYGVESTDAILPLGEVAIQAPYSEQLKAARFDGDHAFAIMGDEGTSVSDPLFTFDLSDPTAPKLGARIEMPGFLYAVEPRGNRLLALGFDNDSSDLQVSNVDISDLDNPKLLSRVHFGSDWVERPIDLHRMLKGFKLLEPEGLALVSFGVNDQTGARCPKYSSGIQLIDLSSDTLATRGVAPASNEFRQNWLSQQGLYAVSDHQVELFDISDRDHPSRTTNATLVRHSSQTQVVNDQVVSVAASWWSQSTSLAVVNRSDAAGPAVGEVSVDNPMCVDTYPSLQLFTDSGVAYVVQEHHDPVPTELRRATVVLAFDISNPAEPTLLGRYTQQSSGRRRLWALSEESGWQPRGLNGAAVGGKAEVMTGSTLAMLRSPSMYLQEYEAVDASLEVVDFSDPAQPKTTVIPFAHTLGLTGLIAWKNTILTSHYEPVSDGRVEFFLDRIDVSNPSAPTLEKINIPGSLLAVDPTSGKLLTVSYKRHEAHIAADSKCPGVLNNFIPDDPDSYPSSGICKWLSRQLNLVSVGGEVSLQASLQLTDVETPAESAMGDGVFFTHMARYPMYGDDLQVSAIAGFAAGKLTKRDVMVPLGDAFGFLGVAARGQRAAFAYGNHPFAVDASDPSVLRLSQSKEVYSRYRFRPVRERASVSLDDTQMYVSQGEQGLTAVPLEAK
ncbi:MAG: beta-propeller domain-containing protein [Polyangiaceae bacterium]